VNQKQTNKKYIARYIFLKILFEEYHQNTFIPSENFMKNYFSTTALTVRQAYNILIGMDILEPIKGKGYFIKKNIVSYFWPIYNYLNELEWTFTLDNYNCQLIFTKENEIIMTTNFLFTNKVNLKKENLIFSIFQELFSSCCFDWSKIDISKSYSFKENLILETTNIKQDEEDFILLSIENKFSTKYIQFLNSTSSIKF